MGFIHRVLHCAPVLAVCLLTACKREPPPAPGPPPAPPIRAAAALPMHPGTGDPDVCVCAHRLKANVWCEKDQVGYVAGMPVRSAILFKTLDAHGHEIDPNSLTCATCRAANRDGGYCDACHTGWHHGLAYMTRFTWLLAQGERVSDATPLCADCRARANAPERATPGWCERCGGGVVGDVFLRDRNQFLAAAQGASTLAKAIETLPRCEMCACAMVYDRTCPVCRVRYVDGVAVPDDAPAPASRTPN